MIVLILGLVVSYYYTRYLCRPDLRMSLRCLLTDHQWERINGAMQWGHPSENCIDPHCTATRFKKGEGYDWTINGKYRGIP